MYQYIPYFLYHNKTLFQEKTAIWPNLKLLSILCIIGRVLKQNSGRSIVATKKQNAWMQPTWRNTDRKYDLENNVDINYFFHRFND
jgi:hypothetical protein